MASYPIWYPTPTHLYPLSFVQCHHLSVHLTFQRSFGDQLRSSTSKCFGNCKALYKLQCSLCLKKFLSVIFFRKKVWIWKTNLKHKTSNIKNVKFRKIVNWELTREVAMNGKADASGSLQGQVVQEHGGSNTEPPTTPQSRPWLYQVKES